jgi:hypothetical protein
MLQGHESVPVGGLRRTPLGLEAFDVILDPSPYQVDRSALLFD